jgi:hypothetical protein
LPSGAFYGDAVTKKACCEVNPSLKADWARTKEPLRGQARAAAIANLERQMADISAQLAQLREEPPERAHRANRLEEYEDDEPVNARGASFSGLEG